ncbi:hypothetical protein [Streptomyces monomycini]|uniref:hypothetical protein n=1 Tax=Streptomyces monomycini TaxID=371720 RepID=UPI0004ABC2B8|nr:hypothetical protein [Streptomyces monomycini]
MTLTFTRRPSPKSYELRPQGAAPVHVLRGVPDGCSVPEGCEPCFTLAAEPAGASPLAVVVRTGGGCLAVLGADLQLLAEIRLPPKKKYWRPAHEIQLPDGTVLRGREGTVPSLLVCLVLLPVFLLYLVAVFWSNSDIGATDLQLRTAWKRPGKPFGRAVMTETARGRFRVRGGRLDRRVAYAQAVASYWER